LALTGLIFIYPELYGWSLDFLSDDLLWRSTVLRLSL